MTTFLPPAAPVESGAWPVRGAAATDALVRRVSAGLAVASTGLVVLWWIQGGGVTDLTRLPEALTSWGRLTGLLGSQLLLLQVLLMARLPVVERAVGQDRLTAIHRLVGFSSLNLILAHIGLITWGYAAGVLGATPGTLLDLTLSYPGMLMAAGGTALLVLVAVTSVRAARGRLRYESWHLLHLYGYLGVGLALPHQLWTGHEFLTSPAATAYWWGLWGATAAAVLVWRVGLPVVRNVRHGLRVTSVVPEGPDTWSVYVTGRALHRLPVRAGQFFTWRFLDGPGWTRGNPYSVSAAPDGRSLRFTVARAGDGSSRVASLRPGTRVLVEGPFGRLTERPRTVRPVLLIGAGVGIAPLRALAEGLDYAPGEAVLLHRYRDVPLFADEFAALAGERGLRIVALPGRRRPGSWWGATASQRSDADLLTAHVPDVRDRDVYLCGPHPWSDDVVATLTRCGVPAERIHRESFGW